MQGAAPEFYMQGNRDSCATLSGSLLHHCVAPMLPYAFESMLFENAAGAFARQRAELTQP